MGSALLSKVFYAFSQIKKGNILAIFKGIMAKVYSKELSFALKMDLTQELKKPRSFIDVSVRLYQESDAEFFIEDNENTSLIKQLPKCYVAVTKDNQPCFRQWVLSATQNKKIKEFWGNSYPELRQDEALMESAFTIPKLRGMGVMPLALYKIAQECKKDGINYIITITPKKNGNSLRALDYAGFKPYSISITRSLLFNKSVKFFPLNEEYLNHYKELTVHKGRARKK